MQTQNPLASFPPTLGFSERHVSKRTCDIHIIVQGDHGEAPLVGIWEIWELMPLLCAEEETVLVIENTSGTGTRQRYSFILVIFSSVLSNNLCCSSADMTVVTCT